MKNRMIVICAAMTALASSLLLAGCEREIAHTEDTKVKDDGTVKTKEKTVTESPNGTVTKTEESRTTSTNKP